MRKKISEIVEIPEGIHAEITDDIIKIKKGNETVDRVIQYAAKVEGNKIIIACEKPTKKQKKLIKSTAAHIRNLIQGLGKKYIYKLQICAVHFPMTASIKGEEIIIKNFLGEVKDRKTKILKGVNVKVEKEFIIVESANKEKAGQTAANIENATRITNKDRRVFQDGIYIIEKNKGKTK